MTTQEPPAPQGDLAQLLDAIDDLVTRATTDTHVDDWLAVVCRRCRSALGADAVLVAVRRDGRPTVVGDADDALDPTEMGRQLVLARASLDDPVIDGHPGLPVPDGERPLPRAVVPRSPRRLVAELPGRSHVRGTLTVCRRPAFAAAEVEVVMAFAGLAALVEVAAPTRDLSAMPGPHQEVDVTGRLFAVGLTLHLALRSAGDTSLRSAIEDAVDQVDQAILDIRRRAFTGHRQA